MERMLVFKNRKKRDSVVEQFEKYQSDNWAADRWVSLLPVNDTVKIIGKRDDVTNAHILIVAMRDAVEAQNVYEYYAAVFQVEPEHDAGTVGLRGFPMDSHCGRECKKIIDKAKELLDMCDTHPHVQVNIRRGVVSAIEIICFG